MNRLFVAAIAALTLLPAAASAAKVKSIHSFCGQSNCVDGSQSWAPPVTDGAGNWYGTTALGGTKNSGVIYRMSLNAGHWHYTRLYSFCVDKKCTDGAGAHGRLIIDTKGNLYGVATKGGAADMGAIFELMPAGDAWTYKKLHDFCVKSGCPDGSSPTSLTLAYQGQASGSPYDGKSPLFGATTVGGASNGGVVFKLTLSKGKWSEKVIHDFCSAESCTDGLAPYTGVMIDGSGNLFGAVLSGGAYGGGAIYELIPHGQDYNHVVLHSFCADKSTCVDGVSPIAVPVMDAAGNLFGTTFSGGEGLGHLGTVWKIVPNGVHSKFTKLHDFCNESACTDGSNPWSSLVIDADGHLIGTTYFGGDMNTGTIYRLAGTTLKAFTKMVSFGSAEAPGGAPLGGLTPETSTTYLGTTALAGANAGGDFYRFTP